MTLMNESRAGFIMTFMEGQPEKVGPGLTLPADNVTTWIRAENV